MVASYARGMLVMSMLLTSGSALAQTAASSVGVDTTPAQGPTAENDIVVTAQGREQRLQDVPISASVVSGDLLSRQGIRSTEDLTTRLPNVRISSGGTSSDLLNIRGVGSGLSTTFEQSVATFVDGVYRGRSRASRAALFDIDRVEVLRGPQTTFFGNNAIAGALNISTRKPSDTFGYNATALYSPTDGEFNLEAGVTGPITDSLSGRIAARYSGMNGFIKNDVTGGHSPHLRDFVGRASLAWRPSDTWESDLRVDIGRNRDTGIQNYELEGCPAPPGYPAPAGVCARAIAAGVNEGKLDYHSSSPLDSRFRYNYVEAALINRISIGEHRLIATTGYFDHDVFQLFTNYPINLPGVGGSPSLNTVNNNEDYHSYSQELRLESPTGRTFEYTLGAYYAHENLYTDNYTGLFFTPFGAFAGPPYTAATPAAIAIAIKQKTDNKSVFGAATIHVGPSARVNLGLRYSSVSKNATRESAFGTTSSPIMTSDTFVPGSESVQNNLARVLGSSRIDFPDKKRTDNKLLPSVNLQYDITPDVMAYGSYAKGFKAGGFALGSTTEQFGPESVDAFEVGLKGSALDRRVTFNLALFNGKYKGLQEALVIVLANGVQQAIVGNVGAARSKGVEFGATARLSDFLSISADVAYLDSRYTDYPAAPCTGLQTANTPLGTNCVQDLSGKRRAYSPKFSGNVGASVRIPAGDYQVRFDPSLYFSSKFYQQPSHDPLLLQEGYAKVDARLGFGPEDGRWEVAVIGKNLTDKETASFRGLVGTAPGATYVAPERPRSVAFQITVKN